MKKILIAILYIIGFIAVFNALDYAYAVFFLKREYVFNIGSGIITPAIAGLIMFFLFHRTRKEN
ncbi:MAG: hypothetical protein K5989_06295 [Lachnospiraceae bacterium]|nr:hypothetical protein [Lachnospiraceae bacterium]